MSSGFETIIAGTKPGLVPLVLIMIGCPWVCCHFCGGSLACALIHERGQRFVKTIREETFR